MAEIKDTDKAIKQSNKIIKGVDTTSDKFEVKSNKIKDDAIKLSLEITNDKTSPFKTSALVAKDVDRQLNDTILNANKSFEDFVQATESYLSNNFSINLTKRDLEVIGRKSSNIISDLVTNTDVLNSDIQKILTQNLAEGVALSQLALDLKDLYPAYARNASTLLRTGMSRLFIDINVNKFREFDFNWYIWSGARDSKNREMPCKHWVFHRFPASQLDQVTSVRMNLWNCRHTIQPILDDEINQYPLLDLKFAP